MIELNKTHLQAVVKCAAKKDARYYLLGVCLDVASNGDVHLVATNGHILFAGLICAPDVQWTDKPQKGPFQLIIPRDAVLAACKAKTKTLTLTAMPDGRYMLGDTVFAPMDGMFPDWRRVSQWPENAVPEIGHYDPELLLTASEAVATWHGCKFPTLHQFGRSAAFITGADMTGFAVIMPRRTDDDGVRPFTAAR